MAEVGKSFVFHDKHANITARTIRSIRRHRQTRRSHGVSPVIRTPTPRLPESGGGAIQLPERSYSFRSQQESESGSLYKLYGRFAESETSSRYSASVRDAKDIAGRYQKELGLGVV
jgi:hypothetical protein